ncbi:hypothetical protein [Methylobacterium longum]|uniref:Pectate lyase superfamily protein domain-containing protein n=1 Tax=Methylobacterium longum TaxID=767694 RepID=A0ABT8AN89_9HYPH|nr:hypothetical protein [Methylobacterium longum]MDN3571307.1 hypothetical protein [Methylobacterium longum]GJE09161.1 hypothetical protein FOHLNKBM_0181 [Methylobacterium longum]
MAFPIASLPSTDFKQIGVIPAGIGSPALIRGSADLSTSPGVVVGSLSNASERVANGRSLQAALNWCAINGKYAEMPPGRYEFIAVGRQDRTNIGLHCRKEVPGLIGAGAAVNRGTTLIQYAKNQPVLTIGDVGQNDADSIGQGQFRGYRLGYGVDQSGHIQANGLLLGRICFSNFDDITVSRFASGILFDPYIGICIGASDRQFFFSNLIGRVEVDGAQQSLLSMNANSTGNHWNSLYLGGGTFGRRVALSGPAMWANLSGAEFGSIAQLNIEWCEAPIMLRNDSLALNIDHLHIEGVAPIGLSPSLVRNVAGMLNIRSFRALNCWFNSKFATGTIKIFAGFNDARTSIEQADLRWDGADYHSEATSSLPIDLYKDDRAPSVRGSIFEVGQFQIAGHSGHFKLDSKPQSDSLVGGAKISFFRRYTFDTMLSSTEGVTVTMEDESLTIYGQHKYSRVVATNSFTANRILRLGHRLAANGPGSSSKRLPGDIIQVYRPAESVFDLQVRAHDGASILFTFYSGAPVETEKFFEWSGDDWVLL